jgi:cytochrome c biogenesis factor
VTLGYSATAIAGSIGAAFIIFGLLTPKLDAKLFKALGSINYGVLCFATMLSFVGTVLGGFWADYSWGRFWGWDPKENGALMIVLWNAVVLHARWGGMVKQRGAAVLSVFGNIVVAWSYFGTNLLGVGLHSYGFTSSGIALLIAWNLANLVVIGLGSLIPPERWSSFGGQFDSPTGSGVKAAVRGRALQPAAR